MVIYLFIHKIHVLMIIPSLTECSESLMQNIIYFKKVFQTGKISTIYR